MKAKHLLAAFVLPAVFTACSQDELITNNAEKEAVGTPIGYLEFTASKGDPTTRLTGAGWEAGDKIGMGWISAGASLPAGENLFSNHPLFYRDGSSFKSETMIYEGLYIASFPFQETKVIAPLEFDLSVQKSEDNYISKRWYVSDKFINLTEETAGLGKATPLELVPLTNLMKLNIKLGEDANLPEDLKVTGVTLKNATALTNKLTLISNAGSSVIKNDGETLVDGAWDGNKSGANYGDILVNIGEEVKEGEYAGTAIDKTNGLDVYIQMGKFTDDNTELVIHTNYGNASIASGKSGDVTWSSTKLEQKEAADVATFAAATTAMKAGADSKSLPYGQNVAVNVTLGDIKISSEVTNQEDLVSYVNMLEKLGKLEKDATVTFTKSTLKIGDQGVTAEGDVVITDISVLNKIKGAITFEKNSTPRDAPTNVYIAGELALDKDLAGAIDFTIMNGQTLTVSKNLALGENLLTVDKGATLINKAEISVGGTADKGITTTAGEPDADPAVPAGLYISEGGTIVLDGSAVFTNNGAIEWKSGTLPSITTDGGLVYANVADIKAMVKANSEFVKVTGATAIKEIIISNNLTVASQLTGMTFENITKMTINGDVTFNLEDNATPFTFSALTAINVESGSFNLTGGDQGTTETSFCAFTAEDGCTLTLAKGTKLNLAAGTKLDLGDTGKVDYKGAAVANAGWINAGSSAGDGDSSWNGNSVKNNPKATL